MKTKITSRKLVRALYLEAEEWKMNSFDKINYFLYGYNEVIKSGMDELEYWRCVLVAYPDLVDKVYEKLSDRDINSAVKEFLKKMALLK